MTDPSFDAPDDGPQEPTRDMQNDHTDDHATPPAALPFTQTLILAGQAPMAAIDSPSSTHKYQVVLREEARGLHLMQALVVID
ncbi:MAG: hypothetical protein LC713_05605, partial [Actinobacteria bacterium]|nr:hypothetical protein [Actinomycetota bacterium]